MKEEIQKIMRMYKKGTITNEQAAERIMSLAEEKRSERTATGEAKRSRAAGSDSFRDIADLATNIADRATRWAGKVVESAVDEKNWKHFGETLTAKAKLRATDAHSNSATMSRFVPPTGAGFEFSDNSIQVSSVAGLELTDSTWSDTSIQASKVEDAVLRQSTLQDASFNGSSVDKLVMTKSEINDTSFNASRLASLSLTDAEIEACSFNGVNLKNVTLEAETEIGDCSFNGVSFTDSTLRGSSLGDCSFDGVALSGCTLEGVKIEATRIRKIRFTNLTLKNVELADFRLENKILRDKVLDGTEAFLAALGLAEAEKHAEG